MSEGKEKREWQCTNFLFLLEVDKVPEDSSEVREVGVGQGGLPLPLLPPPLLHAPQAVGQVRGHHRQADAVGAVIAPGETKHWGDIVSRHLVSLGS